MTSRKCFTHQSPHHALVGTVLMMHHPLLRIVFISLLTAQSTPNTVLAQVKPSSTSGVIGKVQSVTDSSIDVQTVQESPRGHTRPSPPISRYRRIESCQSTSYVGVASTEQADGKK